MIWTFDLGLCRAVFAICSLFEFWDVVVDDGLALWGCIVVSEFAVL
jgi:hypothetical protein